MQNAEIAKWFDSGKIIFFPGYRAAVLSYNGEEEINVKLYSSRKELYSWGMIGGFLNTMNGKKNKILYSGQLKHFDGFNYGNKKVDKEKMNLDEDKMHKAISQLGGHMESYVLVSRYYVPEKALERISFEQAEELVKNKKAELKWYGHEKDFFLSYGDALYYRSDHQRAYLY
ncbi:hypothetical protein HYS72_02865 [Candidatus Pacearchaeota archaeon]|nr:hypothetical protein [Candidatus Pacearchaeota archaeon]MBI2056737.1 hypothetical protein [Candidatus Pacearchaeota archaeon]